MTPALADEIRQAFAKIITRYEGKHEAIAPIQVEHVRAVAVYCDDLELQSKRCTCGAADPGFDPFRRETKLDFALKLEHAKRVREIDAGLSWKPYGREIV